MGGKPDYRHAAFFEAVVAFFGLRRVGDDVRGRRAETGDGKFIQVREFDRDTAEIVPDAGEDLLDLGAGFFWKCGTQVVAAEAVFLKQRTNLAHGRAGKIRRALAVEALD